MAQNRSMRAGLFKVGDTVRLKGSQGIGQRMTVYRTADQANLFERTIQGLVSGFVKVEWKGPLGGTHWDVLAEATLELIPSGGTGEHQS